MKATKTTRDISGGSKVDIYSKSEDKRLYFAVVYSESDYPEKGVAINRNQTEGIFVIEGELTITVNDEEIRCVRGDVVYFEEGKEYTVSGKGTAVVAITPAEGGQTEIVNK